MSIPLRVLLVEDSEVDAALLLRALQRGGYDPTFERVDTADAMAEALATDSWDVVISDYAMPSFSAPEALQILKSSAADLPFVIVSGAVGEEIAVAAMRSGAHDYISKYNLARLVPAIEREMRDAKVRSERSSAERATLESEGKYRALFEQSVDAIYVADRDGRIVDANQAATELFGYARTELLDLHVVDLYVDPEDWPRFIDQTERDGSTRNYDARLANKDGMEMHCLLSSTVHRSGEGTITGHQGVVRDITERKRLEEQVGQRTRMASLGQLAGGIAHDFNNILMGVILHAEILLAEETLPGDLAPDVQSIYDEATEGAQLVRQIMDFSRHSPMETQILDLKDFIADRIDILRRTLPASIKLLLEVEPGELTARIDPTLIQQVVMNLVVNARDAMQDAGELRVSLSRLEVGPNDEPPVLEMSPGQWLCLAVSDTGTGIPPEVIPHLFEPFFTTKPRGEGTGLGLAQIYGIVKQHAGHVGLDTELGNGTTFTVYLPAREAEPAPPEEQHEAAPTGRGETVLVVEDERTVRESCRRTLESLGYRVSTARNGEEALATYHSEGGFDLVLTDMVMPVMCGQDLIRELRKADSPPRILAMTGYVLAKELRALRSEGHLHTIHKPLDVNTLARGVRKALDAIIVDSEAVAIPA
jgi:two-component system cell cycle sensor histidine kinase/response regulator CckA